MKIRVDRGKFSGAELKKLVEKKLLQILLPSQQYFDVNNCSQKKDIYNRALYPPAKARGFTAQER